MEEGVNNLYLGFCSACNPKFLVIYNTQIYNKKNADCIPWLYSVSTSFDFPIIKPGHQGFMVKCKPTVEWTRNQKSPFTPVRFHLAPPAMALWKTHIRGSAFAPSGHYNPLHILCMCAHTCTHTHCFIILPLHFFLKFPQAPRSESCLTCIF